MGYLQASGIQKMPLKPVAPADNLLQRLRNELFELTLECRQMAARLDKDANTTCFSNYAYFELSQNAEMDKLAEPYRQVFDYAVYTVTDLIRPANGNSFNISSLENSFKAVIPKPVDTSKIITNFTTKEQIDNEFAALKTKISTELGKELQNYSPSHKEEPRTLDFFKTREIEKATQSQYKMFLSQKNSNADFNDSRVDADFQRLIKTPGLPEDLSATLQRYNRRGKSLLTKLSDLCIGWFE